MPSFLYLSTNQQNVLPDQLDGIYRQEKTNVTEKVKSAVKGNKKQFVQQQFIVSIKNIFGKHLPF